MNALRERFTSSSQKAGSGGGRRKRANFLVRSSATLTAKLIFSTIYTVILVALLYVAKVHFEWADLYQIGDHIVLFFQRL